MMKKRDRDQRVTGAESTEDDEAVRQLVLRRRAALAATALLLTCGAACAPGCAVEDENEESRCTNGASAGSSAKDGSCVPGAGGHGGFGPCLSGTGGTGGYGGFGPCLSGTGGETAAGAGGYGGFGPCLSGSGGETAAGAAGASGEAGASPCLPMPI